MASTLTDMAKAKLQPIGKYVHLVDERNSDLSISNLVGLTIEKRYIASVANIIGTDLSKYKIIRKGRFACSLMQVSRDKKMPVAMYDKDEPAIISPAYPMFEVNDEEELMPEYLNMYFMREEFDREAVFYAVGGVRGSLEWDDFMAMKMPIPDIKEQRRIVDEYKAIEKRIDNNNRLIQKLEETAQAIYYHTFVENIDPDDLPEGWKKGKLSDVAKEKKVSVKKSSRSKYSIYLPIESVPREQMVYFEADDTSEAESSLIAFENNDILMGAIRPYFHKVVFARHKGITRSTCLVINPIHENFWAFLMCTMFDKSTIDFATYNSIGTTMPYVTWKIMQEMDLIVPSEEDALEFNNKIVPILMPLKSIADEQKGLIKILPLLLNNM